MAHALLASIDAHHLIRRDGHAEPPLVVAAHGVQQLRQVPQAVLPVVLVLGCVHERLLHMGRGLKVRRAHRQVEQGAALCLQGNLALVQGRKDLVAKQVETLGKFHDKQPSFLRAGAKVCPRRPMVSD